MFRLFANIKFCKKTYPPNKLKNFFYRSWPRSKEPGKRGKRKRKRKRAKGKYLERKFPYSSSVQEIIQKMDGGGWMKRKSESLFHPYIHPCVWNRGCKLG
jgi:hypothetical protein